MNSQCADSKLMKLCSEYVDMLPCCNTIMPSNTIFRDRAKILWGWADCLDLFELKNDLAKTKGLKFKTKSLCMYPVLKKGDILKIASAKIEDIKIGDIPVYRSRDRLYAHRVVDKKMIDGEQFIITRPDTSVRLDDSKDGEKVSEENILGKIEQIQRGRKIFSPEGRNTTAWDRFLYMKIKAFSRLAAFSEKALKAVLTKIQSLKAYEVLGRKLTARMKSSLNFELAAPFSNQTLNRLYNYISLTNNENVESSWLKQAKTFHLVIKFNNSPIGCVSFLNRPNICPHQGFWIADFYIRLRYRGLGLDTILLAKAKEICKQLEIEDVKQCSLDKGLPVESKFSRFVDNTEELLLICARKDLDEKLKRKAESLIKEGVDWQRFSELAMRGGVTIVVYEALRAIGPDVYIPQFVLERLKSGYLFIAWKTASQHNGLLALLKLFARRGVSVLPLKGTLLAKRLYGDIAARGLSVDFDLLIQENDKERTRMLLQEAGYSAKTDNEKVSQWQWQHSFSRPKAMMVELHWDITMMGRAPERIAGLWRGVREVKENGASFYDFQEEELLLYLAAHLVNSSRFSQLRYFCDINALLHQYQDTLSWDSIIAKARAWKMSNSLYLALRLSCSLFNANLAPEVLQKLKPHFLKLILIRAFVNKRVILRGGLRRRLIDKFLHYVFFELLEAKGLSENLAVIKRVLFPPQELLLKTKVNASKPIFLRYILRLFSGVFKILRRLVIPLG